MARAPQGDMTSSIQRDNGASTLSIFGEQTTMYAAAPLWASVPLMRRLISNERHP